MYVNVYNLYTPYACNLGALQGYDASGAKGVANGDKPLAGHGHR